MDSPLEKLFSGADRFELIPTQLAFLQNETCKYLHLHWLHASLGIPHCIVTSGYGHLGKTRVSLLRTSGEQEKKQVSPKYWNWPSVYREGMVLSQGGVLFLLIEALFKLYWKDHEFMVFLLWYFVNSFAQSNFWWLKLAKKLQDSHCNRKKKSKSPGWQTLIVAFSLNDGCTSNPNYLVRKVISKAAHSHSILFP